MDVAYFFARNQQPALSLQRSMMDVGNAWPCLTISKFSRSSRVKAAVPPITSQAFFRFIIASGFELDLSLEVYVLTSEQ